MSDPRFQSGLARFFWKLDPIGRFILPDSISKAPIESADWINKQGHAVARRDPIVQFDRRSGLSSWTKETKGISDWAYDHPGDASLLVGGAVVGGGAAAGAGGGGGGAGAAGAGAAGGVGAGSAAGAAGAGAALPTVTVVGSSGSAIPGLIGAGAAGAAAAAAGAPSAGNPSGGGVGFGEGQGWGMGGGGQTNGVSNFWGSNPAYNAPSDFGTGAGTAGQGVAQSGSGGGLGSWMKLAGQMGQPQQQQQAPMAPPPQRQQAMPSPIPTMGQRLSGGLGRVGETLFPIDPKTGMTPDQMKAMRTNAMMQMGLGMMAASDRGGRLGQSLGAGYGLASSNMQGAMQQAYENAMKSRAETRADKSQTRQDEMAASQQAHEQWLQEHTLTREQTQDDRFKSEQDFRLEQADQAQKRWESEQKATSEWRKDELAAREQRAPPAGYRYKADGSMEYIPGGPADPNVATNQRTLRPIPPQAAKGIIENRASMKQIDRALKAVADNPDAFGMQNYMPGMVTQRWSGKEFSGGNDARAQVADIGSLKLHDRSGAAITASEFPRLAPFIPQSTDDPKTVKTKLENLKANLESMQEEIEGFYTPDAGYRPLVPASSGGGLGNPSAPRRPPLDAFRK